MLTINDFFSIKEFVSQSNTGDNTLSLFYHKVLEKPDSIGLRNEIMAKFFYDTNTGGIRVYGPDENADPLISLLFTDKAETIEDLYRIIKRLK